MEDLNEIIIQAIFNKLKIDGIVTASLEYSWVDGDENGRVYSGVDLTLTPDLKCYGVNIKNKTVEPIYQKLNQNIKECVPEKIYNFLIAKCLEDESYKKILNQKAITFISDTWRSQNPQPNRDCCKGDKVAIYCWELLLKEQDKIKIISGYEDFCDGFAVGDIDDFHFSKEFLELDVWKVFQENYSLVA